MDLNNILKLLLERLVIFKDIIIFLLIYFFILTMISQAQKLFHKKLEKNHIKEKIHNYFIILRWIVNIIFFVILIAIILSKLGIKIGSILVSLGAFAGLVIFVLQQFIQNIIKGFIIIFQDQIRKNEWVIINKQFMGKVIDIKLFHLVLRDENHNIVYLTNSSIDSIVNLSRYKHKFILKVKVKRNLSIDEIKSKFNDLINNYFNNKSMDLKVEEDFELNSDNYQFSLIFYEEYKKGLKLSSEIKKDLLKLFGDEIIEVVKT